MYIKFFHDQKDLHIQNMNRRYISYDLFVPDDISFNDVIIRLLDNNPISYVLVENPDEIICDDYILSELMEEYMVNLFNNNFSV